MRSTTQRFSSGVNPSGPFGPGFYLDAPVWAILFQPSLQRMVVILVVTEDYRQSREVVRRNLAQEFRRGDTVVNRCASDQHRHQQPHGIGCCAQVRSRWAPLKDGGASFLPQRFFSRRGLRNRCAPPVRVCRVRWPGGMSALKSSPGRSARVSNCLRVKKNRQVPDFSAAALPLARGGAVTAAGKKGGDRGRFDPLDGTSWWSVKK